VCAFFEDRYPVPCTRFRVPGTRYRINAEDRTPSTEDRPRPLENAHTGYASCILRPYKNVGIGHGCQVPGSGYLVIRILAISILHHASCILHPYLNKAVIDSPMGVWTMPLPGLTIEFFHDVLCAWCYAFSPRVRRLVRERPEITVVHRCFALAPTPEAMVEIFGSKERGKREILNHWRAANLNDDEHRINADLMAQRPFDYPYSMPGLLACKAAEMQGGPAAHWDMFDRVQRAHLTECLNIADFEVLRQCAVDVGLDVGRWERDYGSAAVREAVERDLARARLLGITGVPTLVAEGRFGLVGAQTYQRLTEWVDGLVAVRRP